MPRGGKRKGQPGKSYPNRTDMNLSRVAPGQTYGKAQAQKQAMSQVPVAAPPEPQAPDLAGMAASWQPLPGSPTETQRPDEPVTAGLASGPGPGPEVLPQIENPDMTALAYNDSQDMKPFMNSIRMMEWLASQPNSSPSVRILYRQLLNNRMGT